MGVQLFWTDWEIAGGGRGGNQGYSPSLLVHKYDILTEMGSESSNVYKQTENTIFGMEVTLHHIKDGFIML